METEEKAAGGEAEPYRPGALRCRRCPAVIAAGAAAHLVARRPGEGAHLRGVPPPHIVVCDGCLRREEVGFQEDATRPLPPIRLTPGELGVLRLAARGRVYRAARGGGTKLHHVADGSNEASPNDSKCTSMGYTLYRNRLIDWLLVPVTGRIHDGPTAWAVVTDEGERHLVGDNPENEEEELPSARTRKVGEREMRAFTTAAHSGRCHTSESGLIMERVGRWGSAASENIRRDPAGRACLEAGYVVRDANGKFDSTKTGRARYDLAPTAAHLAAERAAREVERTTGDGSAITADRHDDPAPAAR